MRETLCALPMNPRWSAGELGLAVRCFRSVLSCDVGMARCKRMQHSSAAADHLFCSFSTRCWLLQSRQGRCWGVVRCVRWLPGAGDRQCRSHVQRSPAPGARGLGSRCGPQPR